MCSAGFVVEPIATRTGFLRCALNQVRNRGFDGRRTKHGLAIGGQGRQDLLDGGKEAHVEHPVGFVQNQGVSRAQLYQLALEEIGEPPGRGDEHLRALANRLQLRLFIQTADDDGGADACSGGELSRKLR